MRSLGSLIASALAAPVQRPAVLVEVGFATPLRISSASGMTWDSRTWVAGHVTVEGLQVGALSVAGTITIGNHDGAIGALIAAEAVKDRVVKVYGYDAAEPTDVVWLCDAVATGAQVNPRVARIQIGHRAANRYSPSMMVGTALTLR